MPFVAVSVMAEVFNFWETRADVERCLKTIDSFIGEIPPSYFSALVAAEDHRNGLHPGVDLIAIIRAGLVRLRVNQIEGASTIEQQFVRTVTGRYERSIGRKMQEQAVAIAISRRRSKFDIGSAYLSIAFYGSGCIGLAGLKRRCGNELRFAEQRTILGMIARLKYPEPLHNTKRWRHKIGQRIQYIETRMPEASIACETRLSQEAKQNS